MLEKLPVFNSENKKQKLEAPKYEPKEEKEIIYKVKSKRIWFYLVPILNIIGSIGLFAILWGLKISPIFLILYAIIVIPFFLFSGVAFFIRLYLDRRKISGAIIKRVAKNYIVANFFRENKRIEKVVSLIKPDKTFSFNKGDYTVDLDAIWFDSDNRPNSLYLEGIPSPLLLEFHKDINKFITNVLQKNPEVATSKEGLPIDVSFSATTLQMLKKDKIFAELQRNPESEKLVYVLIGVIVLALIVVGASFLFK